MTGMSGGSRCPRCGATLAASVASGVCPACLLKQAALGTGADSFPATPWTPPSVEELASAFPQLEVLSLIGHGGMGAVYKARQKSLGRLVALKILAPQHAANPDFAERFAREAKVLAEVSHPNIVTVHDFGQAGQTEQFYFLTMEFVDGVNLRQAMKAGRLTPQQALAIVPPICEALQFAHDRGIVHRDIKPENLLLDKEGRVKIADFGIARMLRVGQAFQPDDLMPNAGQAEKPDLRAIDLTQESVLGTPSYMAPEQREHPASVDHRADIFSLGVVLYEMLTGELPGARLQPPSRKVEIDVRLDEIVLRALEHQPELRFQTAAEFHRQVTTVAISKPFSERRKPTIRLPMIASGIASTPEKLATFWGQFFAHRSRAEFVLDENQLSIQRCPMFRSGETTLIPLKSIRDVKVDRYSATVNFAGLDYVRVTYESDGQTRQVCFTPSPGPLLSLAAMNQCVANWCEAIHALKAGREPELTATVKRSPHPAADSSVRPQECESGTFSGQALTISKNREQFGGLRLIALALALGLAVNGHIAVRSGRAAQMLTSDLYYTLILLFPFLIVGLVAGVARRRGTVVGLWALLTGVVVVAAIDYYGYLVTQEALRQRAWTGGALTQGLFAIAAVPAALVGSFVGVAIGLFIMRFGKSSSNDPISHPGVQPPPDGPLRGERSQRHKIGLAASVVWLVTGMILGTVSLRVTEIRVRYDLEWLALTLFMLATSVLPGLVVSNRLKQACQRNDPQRTPSIFGWLRGAAVLGFLMMLAFVAFACGLLDGILSRVLVWDGMTVAILLPIGFIGFVALPWASLVLWKAQSIMDTATSEASRDESQRRMNRWFVAGTIACMVGVAWLVISIPMASPSVEITTHHAQVENGHFTFGYSVQNVPGWNVWLTLENAQLIKSDSPHLEDRGPVVVSRYQAKLVGNGRVRIPLEYLPTTDEGLSKMRASIGPAEGDRAILRPRVHVSRLAYQTESLMRVWAILMMLPEGQTPDSQLIEPTGSPASPRYKTIEPPAQPKLGPFEGTYEQGRVELVVLGPHPSKDQPCWKPNGEPSPGEIVPEHNGKSWAAESVIKEVVIRVHSSTGQASRPVLRFADKSKFSGMGSSRLPADAKQSGMTLIQMIACPREARETTVEVGVADGDWYSAISFDRHPNQSHFGTSSHLANGTSWEGSVRKSNASDDTVALAFSYSYSNDFETRLVYERADGSIERLKENGSDGSRGLINSLTTLPVKEFETIRKFHVQSRRYQWVEFRNVSLQLGHRTNVEVQNAGLFFPPTPKPLKETASAQREGEAPAEPRLSKNLGSGTAGSAGASPSQTHDSPSNNIPNNADKIDTAPIIQKLVENEKFVRGFRVKTEAKIRQRVGNNFSLPEIERVIKTSFAIDERGWIRSEQTGGVPGQIGTTDVRQQQEVAVFDGLMLKLLQGPPNGPGNWGYHGRDKSRMPREVDPRNYLLEHANERLRPQISGGQYLAVGKEMWKEREVIAFESSTTTRESEKTSYRGRLLLDPSLGYAAVYRASQIRFDDLGPEWHDFARYEVSDYKPATGGLFVPGRAIYTSLLPNRDVIKAKQPIETAWQHDIRFLDWELNPEFTVADFQLNFPDGIFVMDESQQPPANVPAAKPTDSNSSAKPTEANADRVLFTGQVFDAASKKPIAGAEVIMRYRDNDWQKQEALARADGELIPLLAERRATTDAAGQFSFGIPPECEGRDIAIERSVWHPDFVVDRSFGHWVVTKSKQHDADAARKLFGTIALHSGHVVTGQVVDIDGQPARGVPIHVAWQYPEYLGFTPLTRTDAAGRYQVRVPGRDEHRIFVLTTHAVPQSLPIKKGFGEQPVVRLERGVRVRGRVLDAAGNGVRDIVVQGNGDDSVYHGIDKPLVRVRTDDEGRYELPPLPLGTDVRVISEGWTGAWQRKGEKLADVYLPTFATFSAGQLKPTETTVPLEEINIDFTPVSSVKLTARCFNVDGTPGDVNAELYGTSPKSERQRWRGRFNPVANQPGLFELRVPKGLAHAALDLMHDGRFKFNDATRAAPPTDTQKTVRTEVRYDIINTDDDTIEIRASTQGKDQ